MNGNAGTMLDVLTWLLVAGLALAVFIGFLVMHHDRIERERENERRGRTP